MRLLPALVAGLAAVQIASAQSSDRSFGYLLLLGTDTIGIERVKVAGGRWTGDVVVRNQGRVVWSGVRDSAGFFGPLELSAFRTASDTAAFQRVILAPAGDSVRLTLLFPAAAPRALATQRGAFIFVNSSFAQMEVLIERLRGRQDTTVQVFLASGGLTFPATLHRAGDTVNVTLAGQLTRVELDSAGRPRGGSVPAQNVRFVRVAGDALARVALGAPNYDAPADAPYSAEHVRIPTPPGHELAATLTMPKSATGRLPVVVTITGSGPQDRDEWIGINGYRPFRQIADTLGRRGIAVLRFDDRGTGASTGNFASATSADFADDVRAIVAWLRARPDIDANRVFLLGHSEGGLIAPLVAATDPRLAGIVLLAGPSRNGRDIIYYQQRYAIDHDTTFKSEQARDSAALVARARFDSMSKSSAWLGFFVDYDPLATAARVKTPTLVLQGANDRQVTAEQAEELGRAIRRGGNRDVTVRVFPGLNHLFLPDTSGNPANYARLGTGRVSPEVLGAIADWIAAHRR